MRAAGLPVILRGIPVLRLTGCLLKAGTSTGSGSLTKHSTSIVPVLLVISRTVILGGSRYSHSCETLTDPPSNLTAAKRSGHRASSAAPNRRLGYARPEAGLGEARRRPDRRGSETGDQGPCGHLKSSKQTNDPRSYPGVIFVNFTRRVAF